jgi:hypothetical protein
VYRRWCRYLDDLPVHSLVERIVGGAPGDGYVLVHVQLQQQLLLSSGKQYILKRNKGSGVKKYLHPDNDFRFANQFSFKFLSILLIFKCVRITIY